MKRYIRADVTDIFDENLEARKAAAKDPRTRPSVLDRLADDEDHIIHVFVAANPSTSTETLTKLAERANYDILQRAIIANPNTPEKIILNIIAAEGYSLSPHITQWKYTQKAISITIVMIDKRDNEPTT